MSAQQHAKNAISILNETWTREIAEKERVNNSTIQALTLANIANKIDRRYANAFNVGYNDTSSSMNMGRAEYESNATTISNSNTADASSSNRSMSNMNMMMMNMMKINQPNSKSTHNNINNFTNNKIINMSDYQSAIGLTGKAQEIFDRMLNTKALHDKAPTIATLKTRLD